MSILKELMKPMWDMDADGFCNAARVHIVPPRNRLKAALCRDPVGAKMRRGFFLSKEGA